eukprot:NODE_11945_length_291_cov_25.165289_g11032_i0.p1 GENE.NODE_11945_length_291_cov_25.165289_g11032_i0~~NODE_11945_length_291_cov_25.165289_g11032_i0.p1  ORF type:complete len:53 (-),score=2.40 NODE_11945_length_291_cov_25.165289_g11032_i0:30-188(-)
MICLYLPCLCVRASQPGICACLLDGVSVVSVSMTCYGYLFAVPLLHYNEVSS